MKTKLFKFETSVCSFFYLFGSILTFENILFKIKNIYNIQNKTLYVLNILVFATNVNQQTAEKKYPFSIITIRGLFENSLI